MRRIHRTRGLMGQQLLEITDEHLATEVVNFRAIAALLVGGIYYTILHSRHNGGSSHVLTFPNRPANINSRGYRLSA